MKNLKTGCHGNAEQTNLVTNTSKKPQQTAGRLRLVCCGENASNFRSFEYLNWKPIQNLKTERLCKGYTGHQTTTTRPAWVWPRSLTNKNQQTSVASTRTNNTENWTRQTLPPLHYNLISAIVKSTNLSKKQLITTWQTTRWQRRGQKQAGSGWNEWHIWTVPSIFHPLLSANKPGKRILSLWNVECISKRHLFVVSDQQRMDSSWISSCQKC